MVLGVPNTVLYAKSSLYSGVSVMSFWDTLIRFNIVGETWLVFTVT